ncbi:hypothetical protein TNIN_171971 [Trichonephila inaurata madagascariensis]|uniref:Uncharacterized protein n=1 Tax=Trichonephila inaurata madagascariensis TaxID=2747483 RepID=A0A8X7BWT3_9ARAC|nr:hypothetical protein TNIN_171971 [Trichonephila inaurata madagascariensis]
MICDKTPTALHDKRLPGGQPDSEESSPRKSSIVTRPCSYVGALTLLGEEGQHACVEVHGGQLKGVEGPQRAVCILLEREWKGIQEKKATFRRQVRAIPSIPLCRYRARSDIRCRADSTSGRVISIMGASTTLGANKNSVSRVLDIVLSAASSHRSEQWSYGDRYQSKLERSALDLSLWSQFSFKDAILLLD